MVEAIQAGEREALRRLYERYSRYAMGVSLRIVPEREDALDIVQDAFVSILTSIGSFEYRGEGSLRNWVAKITTNRALDWMREHDRLQFADHIMIYTGDDPGVIGSRIAFCDDPEEMSFIAGEEFTAVVVDIFGREYEAEVTDRTEH